MFNHIFGSRGSDGYGDKSGGGFRCFLIVSFFVMAVNVVISATGRCPAAAGGAREEQKGKTRKFSVCLIVFGGFSLDVLYGYSIKGVTKKQDGPVRVVFLEALVGRFICFGESDVRPRHFKGGKSRARGEGRERCNLPVTTAKPPVAQRCVVC